MLSLLEVRYLMTALMMRASWRSMRLATSVLFARAPDGIRMRPGGTPMGGSERQRGTTKVNAGVSTPSRVMGALDTAGKVTLFAPSSESVKTTSPMMIGK